MIIVEEGAWCNAARIETELADDFPCSVAAVVLSWVLATSPVEAQNKSACTQFKITNWAVDKELAEHLTREKANEEAKSYYKAKSVKILNVVCAKQYVVMTVCAAETRACK